MATINFLLYSDKAPATIYARVREGRLIDAYAPTYFSIHPDSWSKAKGRPKSVKEVSLRQLDSKLHQLNDLLTRFISSSDHPFKIQIISTNWLKGFIAGAGKSITEINNLDQVKASLFQSLEKFKGNDVPLAWLDGFFSGCNMLIDRKEENNFINDFDKLINRLFNVFGGYTDKMLDKETVFKEVQSKTDALPNDLIKFFETYINDRKNELKEGTISVLNSVKGMLEQMRDSTGTTILIQDVDLQFKKRFEDFCKGIDYAPNSIAKGLKHIKRVCTYAKDSGMAVNDQMSKIKVKWKPVGTIYLNFDELEAIEKIQYFPEHLDNDRDWLIISCYSGQRVSDFMKFNSSKIRIVDGKSFIDFTQKKGGQVMTIPLHSKILEILKKRNGEFPRTISEQKYNKHIKEICKAAGITQEIEGSKIDPDTNRKKPGQYPKYELVTSHIGRRSFATNFYGNIPTSLLMACTGHKSERTFLIYIGKSDYERASTLADYF